MGIKGKVVSHEGAVSQEKVVRQLRQRRTKAVPNVMSLFLVMRVSGCYN